MTDIDVPSEGPADDLVGVAAKLFLEELAATPIGETTTVARLIERVRRRCLAPHGRKH